MTTHRFFSDVADEYDPGERMDFVEAFENRLGDTGYLINDLLYDIYLTQRRITVLEHEFLTMIKHKDSLSRQKPVSKRKSTSKVKPKKKAR